MAIEGITFDLMRVTPMDDALLYNALGGNINRVIPWKEKLALTTTGLNVYMAPGAAVIAGRLIKITEQVSIPVVANGSGYICITIDLTKTNSFTGTPGSTNYLPVNNQVRVEAVQTLVQQDLHTTGKIFTYPVASYVSTGSSITLTGLDVGGAPRRIITPITADDKTNITSGGMTHGCKVVGSSSQFVNQGSWVQCLEPGTYKYSLVASMNASGGTGYRNISLQFTRNSANIQTVFSVASMAISSGTVSTEGIVTLKYGDQITVQSSGTSTGAMTQHGGFIERI